jgi:hypothetical protein
MARPSPPRVDARQWVDWPGPSLPYGAHDPQPPQPGATALAHPPRPLPRPTDRGHQESYLLGLPGRGPPYPLVPLALSKVLVRIEGENFAARRQKGGARVQSWRAVRVRVHVGLPANASRLRLREEGPTRLLLPHLSIIDICQRSNRAAQSCMCRW